MAIMSKKSNGMQVALDRISHKMFGHTRSGSIHGDTCVICGGSADSFRDDVSQREYGISGLCQKCQDSVFGE